MVAEAAEGYAVAGYEEAGMEEECAAGPYPIAVLEVRGCSPVQAVRCKAQWSVGIHSTRLSPHTRRRAASHRAQTRTGRHHRCGLRGTRATLGWSPHVDGGSTR